ncbi:MAG: hypothetical protein Q4A75_03140 [Peptostreptococcaceae bacterium]|nr:hypothetical protein [Peptostreptococcaceae bacterium]
MKRSKKLQWAGLILLLALLLTGCGKKVDATAYYHVEIKGMDGYGKATVRLDEDMLVKEISEKGKISIDSMEGLFMIGSYMDRLSYELAPTEGLKNGDEVVLNIQFTPNEQDKVKIIGGTKKIKVSDLPEGTKIDLFKDVEVVFSGVSPKGSAEVINKSEDEFVKTIYFTVEPSRDLKLGDKVTVKANYSEDQALEKMYIIETDTKEFAVEGLDEYLKSASQIDDAAKEAIIKEANDIVEAYLVKDASSVYYEFNEGFYWGSQGYDTSYRFDKANLLTAKDPDSVGYGWTINQLTLFYEATVKPRDKDEAKKGYLAVTFNDSIIRDGKLDVVFSEGKVVEVQKRKDDIERERLTAFKDKYNIEVVDLQIKKKA